MKTRIDAEVVGDNLRGKEVNSQTGEVRHTLRLYKNAVEMIKDVNARPQSAWSAWIKDHVIDA